MHEDAPTYGVVVTVAVIVLVIAIDLGLALNDRKGDTYSEVIRRTARRWWPLVMISCFTMGVLAGHWFW